MSFGLRFDEPNPDHGNPDVFVDDHVYTGNVCSGLGGETICQHFVRDREHPRYGEQCGLDRFQHQTPPVEQTP